MPKNYTDKKNEQRRITSQQIAETQRMIDKKSTELSELLTNLLTQYEQDQNKYWENNLQTFKKIILSL